MRITAFVSGMRIYHFRKADMEILKQLVARKMKGQVGHIILRWHGFRLVGIRLEYNRENVARDPERIKVRVKP